MKKRFAVLSLTMILGLAGGKVLAATTNTPADATFNQVSGKVTVKNALGKTRRIKIGSTAKQGETVTVGQTGQAVMQFFDGSEVDLKPHTEVVITALEHPSLLQKTLKFELKFGNLFAKVKKLLNSKSAFEVEAGGTVCGVRGTEFSFSYDPGTNKIDLEVLDGTVWFTAGGQTQTFNAGQHYEFNNNSNGSSGGKGSGDNGTPNNGTPGNGTPDNGTPNNGTPNNGSGNNGTGNNGTGGALGDLGNQFWGGVNLNHDGTLTDPSVQGSIRVNLKANVPTAEQGP